MFKRMPLYPKYITFMRNGKKTSEGRCNTNLFKNVKVGEEIEFYDKKDPTNNVTIRITEKKEYKTFQELVEGETVSALLPDLSPDDIQGAVRLYRSIPGYAQKETKFGVIALRFIVVQ